MQIQSDKKENIQKAIDNLKTFIQGNIPTIAVQSAKITNNN